jgi:hypothetical protein
VKRCVKVKCTHFAVANELVLDRVSDLARGDAMLLGNVLKLVGYRAEDPGDDDALYVLSSRVIVLQDEQNLITPTSVACIRRIQNS